MRDFIYDFLHYKSHYLTFTDFVDQLIRFSKPVLCESKAKKLLIFIIRRELRRGGSFILP